MSTSVTVTDVPDCDFDPSHGPAHADFKTSLGPWANGCKKCFVRYGGRLGTGKGQKYVKACPRAACPGNGGKPHDSDCPRGWVPGEPT